MKREGEFEGSYGLEKEGNVVNRRGKRGSDTGGGEGNV